MTLIDSFDEVILQKLIDSIKMQQKGILGVIEELGNDLKNADPNTRCSAIAAINNIFSHLSPIEINDQEVSAIAHFLCAKLSDHFLVSSKALAGLEILAKFSNLADADVIHILRTIFADIQVQTLAQKDRQTVLLILKYFLSAKLSVLQQMNYDFVFGFIQCIDGEKDPRNLLLIFELVYFVIANFDIERFREDLFEVVACYFPIDFSPSSRDPGGISREELVRLNMKCLSCTSKFAEYLLPMAIEKLTADLRSSRIDSFSLLSEAVGSYSTDYLLMYQMQLLDAFKRSLFRSAVSSEEREAALKCFQVYAASLVRSASSKTDSKEFFDLLLKECRPNFRELDAKVIQATGEMLRLSASTSSHVCNWILEGTLIDLCGVLADRKDPNSKIWLLDILLQLFSAVLTLMTTESVVFLLSVKDNCMLLLKNLQATSHIGVKSKVFMVLTKTLQIQDFLSTDEAAEIVQLFYKEFLDATDAELLVCLQECLREYLLYRQDSQLVARLLDDALQLQSPTLKHVCSLLGALAAGSSYHQQLLPWFFDRFNSDVSMNSLDYLLAAFNDNMHLYVSNESTKRLSLDLFSRHIETFLARFSGFSRDSNSVKFAFESLQTFFRSLDQSEWSRFSDFIRSVLGVLSKAEVSALYLHSSVLVNLPAEVSNLLAKDVLNDCFAQIQNSSDKNSVSIYVRIYVAFLNKIYNIKTETGGSLPQLVESHIDILRSCLNSDSYWKFVTFSLWVTRACLVGAAALSSSLIETCVFQVILDQQISIDSRLFLSSNVQVLVQSSSEVLTKEHKACVNPFALQKCVVLCLPRLLQLSKEAQHGLVVVNALVNFIQHTPQQFLDSYIEAIVDFAVKTMVTCSVTSDIMEALVSLLASVIQGSSSAVLLPHLQDLLPCLVDQVTEGESKTSLASQAPIAVQLARLRLLSALSRLPTHSIFPYRTQVIKSLSHNLDSPKRLVRAGAAQSRNLWFMLSS